MTFDWRKFTETHFEKYIKNPSHYDDYIGAVHVGDICIDLLIETDNLLICDFYVAHEDTGYGYKNDTLPYDYADGCAIDLPWNSSYEEFKAKAEILFETYIVKNDQMRNYNFVTEKYLEYSLIEHANRPLEIW